jgi:hypothetical protein
MQTLSRREKYMTSKWVIAISLVIAALILPQALAAGVGFSVPGGSTILSYSSTPGANVVVTNSGDANVLSGSGLIKGTDEGVSQYYEWISTDGFAKAAAFAYMEDSGSYQYQFTGSRGSTWARANLKFSATDADNYLLGGFAYNTQDYAGALLSGEWADSIKYSNSQYASSTGVSATQSFSGTGFEDLEATTWAERGYIDYEFTDEAGIDPVLNSWDPDPGYWDEEGPSNAIASEQYMLLYDGDILNPYKPYKATASLSSNTASSSQSVALNGADDDTADVEFWSWARLGDQEDSDEGYEAETDMEADGITEKLGNVVYSSSSKATTLLATASQNVNVYQADWIYTDAESDNYDDELYSYEETDVDRYAYEEIWSDDTDQYWQNEVDSGITSSLIGTDSATARAGISSVTQQLTKASGAYIDKEISADNWVSDSIVPDYDVEDDTSIFGEVYVDFEDEDGIERTDTLALEPLKASTLSGKSIATATLTSASICGNWKASIAKDMTEYDGIMTNYENLYDDVHVDEFFGASFARMGEAYNGDRSVKASVKSTHNAAVSSYIYREADRATEFGTWA